MSIGFADERQAIEGRLATGWNATPIRWENVPFPEQAAPYVALFILDGDGLQISCGDIALRRWPGIIVMQVFVPEDKGTQLAKSYADQLGAIFDRATFSSGQSGTIRCRIPSILSVGITNNWQQVNVRVPFIRDKQY